MRGKLCVLGASTRPWSLTFSSATMLFSADLAPPFSRRRDTDVRFAAPPSCLSLHRDSRQITTHGRCEPKKKGWK